MKEQILGAAIQCFYKDGYAKASMRQIANSVGITQAALYYHFRNKQEILYQLVDRISNKLVIDLRESLFSNKEPLEKLRELIRRQVLLIKTNLEEVKILVEDKKFLEGDLNRFQKEREKLIFDVYRKNLEEAANSGNLNEIDPTVAAFGIIGMTNWLYHWYNASGRLSVDELSDQMTNMAFFGIAKR